MPSNHAFPTFLLTAFAVLLAVAGAVEGKGDEWYRATTVEIAPANILSGTYAAVYREMEEEAAAEKPEWSAGERNVYAVKRINLMRFRHAIEEVANDTQLVLFPEDAITGWPQEYNEGREAASVWMEEVGEVGSNPAEGGDEDMRLTSPSVYYASLYAREFGVTVVIDVGQLLPCQGEAECPADGRWQYNTMLVFDETGVLAAMHHKLHLFEADTAIFDYPPPSLDVYASSFGVDFGLLVCFDVWFQFPGLALAEGEAGEEVENFLLTSWWENAGSFPLVSAANMQQAFSRAAKANLLACSVGMAFVDSGSGIYSPTAGQEFVFNTDVPSLDYASITMDLPKSPRTYEGPNEPQNPRVIKRSTAAVARNLAASLLLSHTATEIDEDAVDKRKQERQEARDEALALISMPDGAAHLSVDVTPGSSLAPVSLTNNNLTCTFSFTAGNSTADVLDASFTYALMAYSGPYFSDLLVADLCSFYHCNEHLGCDHLTVTAGSVPFTSVSVSATFRSDQVALGMASGNDGQLLPMSFLEVAGDAASTTASMAASYGPTELLNLVLYAERLPDDK